MSGLWLRWSPVGLWCSPKPNHPRGGGQHDLPPRLKESKHIWIVKNAEKCGLYTADITIGCEDADVADDIRSDPNMMVKAIREGTRFVILATFNIGDLAWSDRVQNPQQFNIDNDFRTLTTDHTTTYIEDLRKKLQEGGDLFD
jgi:hypothetical protein